MESSQLGQDPGLLKPEQEVLVHDGSLLGDRFLVLSRLGVPGTIAFAVKAKDKLAGEGRR